MLDVVIRLLAHVLIPMFAVGMVGAAVVVAITFMHDLVDFFTEDEVVSPANTLHR